MTNDDFANELAQRLGPGFAVAAVDTARYAPTSVMAGDVPIPKSEWQASGMALLGLMYLLQRDSEAAERVIARARRCAEADTLIP